jgi:hypothetical protein
MRIQIHSFQFSNSLFQPEAWLALAPVCQTVPASAPAPHAQAAQPI